MSQDWETGDTVVYPHYGAGRIIDERTIERNEEEKEYFVVDIMLKQQTVMFPKNETEDVGVRPPTEEDDFFGKLETVQSGIQETYDPEEGEHPDKIHRKSLQSMLDDVREANLDVMMEGLQKLHTRFLDQELNMTEKRFYDTAQQFIIGEIMAILDCPRSKAKKRLDDYLPQELPQADGEGD